MPLISGMVEPGMVSTAQPKPSRRMRCATAVWKALESQSSPANTIFRSTSQRGTWAQADAPASPSRNSAAKRPQRRGSLQRLEVGAIGASRQFMAEVTRTHHRDRRHLGPNSRTPDDQAAGKCSNACPLQACCHMRCSSNSMSRANAAPSNSRPAARTAELGTQGPAMVRVGSQRQHGVPVVRAVAAHGLLQAHLLQEARPDALRKGLSEHGDHWHAHPQGLAGGGVGVARPSVQEDVCAGQAAEVLVRR